MQLHLPAFADRFQMGDAARCGGGKGDVEPPGRQACAGAVRPLDQGQAVDGIVETQLDEIFGAVQSVEVEMPDRTAVSSLFND